MLQKFVHTYLDVKMSAFSYFQTRKGHVLNKITWLSGIDLKISLTGYIRDLDKPQKCSAISTVTYTYSNLYFYAHSTFLLCV